MKLTKYEHACVVLEEANQKVVIDPGNLTASQIDFSNVVALIITHEHPDHFEPRYIEQIALENPNVVIFVPRDLDLKFGTEAEVHTVEPGDEHDVEPFAFTFIGGKHALIHKDFPQPNNVGVLINSTVYYPGDSFDLPDTQPKVLLAPTSGPWLKIGETIDFIDAVKPQVIIPTHNGLLNEVANSLTEQWLSKACERNHATFKHLHPGDSITC